MKRKDTQKLIITAIFIGLIALLTFVPQLGFISLGVISATTVHIPVIIGIVILKDWRYSSVLGLAFGVMSLIKSLTGAGLDLLFINPLVSVLPRVVMSLVAAFFVSKGFKKMNPTLKYGLTAFVGTLTNTILVFTMLLICYYTRVNEIAQEFDFNSAWHWIGYTLLASSILEITIAVILSIITGKVVDRVNKFNFE